MQGNDVEAYRVMEVMHRGQSNLKFQRYTQTRLMEMNQQQLKREDQVLQNRYHYREYQH